MVDKGSEIDKYQLMIKENLNYYPIGLPVLVNHQVGDNLVFGFGSILALKDAYTFGETYFGIVDLAVTLTSQIKIITSTEHFSKRVSALFWCYFFETDLVLKGFKGHWREREVRERIELLTESIKGN
jgi:hypothetical protein